MKIVKFMLIRHKKSHKVAYLYQYILITHAKNAGADFLNHLSSPNMCCPKYNAVGTNSPNANKIDAYFAASQRVEQLRVAGGKRCRRIVRLDTPRSLGKQL